MTCKFQLSQLCLRESRCNDKVAPLHPPLRVQPQLPDPDISVIASKLRKHRVPRATSASLSILTTAQALCNAPKTPTHANGDPEGEYFKCHSGDLTQVFGTWRRLGLPERDRNDTPFTQSVMDYWVSFARTHDPNPDAAYLQVRGYVNTTAQIEASGRWEAVDAADPTMRYLQWPGRQQPLGREEQCKALGLGVDYFLS
jgi:hypothetical protein